MELYIEVSKLDIAAAINIFSGRFAGAAIGGFFWKRLGGAEANADEDEVFHEGDVIDLRVRGADGPRAAVVDVKGASGIGLTIGDEHEVVVFILLRSSNERKLASRFGDCKQTGDTLVGELLEQTVELDGGLFGFAVELVVDKLLGAEERVFKFKDSILLFQVVDDFHVVGVHRVQETLLNFKGRGVAEVPKKSAEVRRRSVVAGLLVLRAAKYQERTVGVGAWERRVGA